MTFRWTTVVGLVALGAAGACGDSSPTEDDSELTDESTSCADAVALTPGTNSLGGTLYTATGSINASDDVDFFSVPADADEWIQILALAELSNSGLDPEVTLYDSGGTVQLAYNDDSATGGLDSTLPYLPLETGSLCIAVSDVQGTDADLGYDVRVLPVAFALYDEFNLDTEPNNSTAAPQTGLSAFGTGGSLFTRVMGVFGTPTDVDVYEWHVPAGATNATVTFTPSFGPDGYGSSTEVGSVEIYEPDGNQVYARLDPRMGARELVARVNPSTTYYVAIRPPAAGAAGGNPFYVFPVGTSPLLNHPETDDVGNDDSGSAETPAPVPTTSLTSYFVSGMLPAPGDTDWWQVSAEAGDEIALFCSSWRIGSGVRDATFSIYDDPLSGLLQSEQEVEGDDIAWSNTLATASQPAVAVTQSGAHYLRVHASTYDAEVSGTYYNCGVHVLGS